VQTLRGQLAAQGFAITDRSLQRDLMELSSTFPIACDDRERPYGWSWQQDAPTFNLPALSIPEALTLAMVETHLKSFLPQPMVKTLEALFQAARQRLNSEPPPHRVRSWLNKVRIVPPTQALLPPRVSAAVHAAVSQALLEERQLRISYRRAGSKEYATYVVHPLGLIQRGTVLYLAVRYEGYDNVRTLALHRIRSAEIQHAAASGPPGFSLDDQVARGTYHFGSGKKLQLVAVFDADTAEHLLESPLSVDQQIKNLDDGRIQITATVLDTLQLRWWLLGFGEYVEVVAPRSLREAFANTAAILAKRYRKAPRR
jgi:predicted DNA-binding transcriptional regulator YafY